MPPLVMGTAQSMAGSRCKLNQLAAPPCRPARFGGHEHWRTAFTSQLNYGALLRSASLPTQDLRDYSNDTFDEWRELLEEQERRHREELADRQASTAPCAGLPVALL